ncbi:hypothetical protein [Flavobacterium sp. WC2429]|uniref:Beta-carotene 15,15'-monooxygenase n=1 Tax=Flavobacterium sp. WC2429 TaxID=3234140 RepID=A0AB39WKU1_9FLAO
MDSIEQNANDVIINIYWENWYYYLAAPFFFFLITVLSNSKNIHYQLRGLNFESDQLEQFSANIKYLFIRIASFTLSFFIFKLVFKFMIQLHDYFISRHLYIFDWLVLNTNEVDNYNKGVYLSLVLTILMFFLFNNAFIKKNSDNWRFREINFNYFKYLFISLILGLGLFFGLFSIFNGIHNLLSKGISDWITKENVLGILPIRLSSLMILYYLLTYIYSEVLHKKLPHFLFLGIFPVRTIEYYNETISFNKRETLFFCQISFYIINIALAEFFIIINFKHIYLSILNFAILFILDDFKIINDYSNGMRKVMKWHFWRIFIFNLIMLSTVITLLVTEDYYWILTLYVILFGVLCWYYLKNAGSISLTNNINTW